MSLLSARTHSRDPGDPRVHDLDVVRFDGRPVALALHLRRLDDGGWRGRLMFTDTESGEQRETAEIFCGLTEDDVWHSLRALREHHVRDLYRSLA